ncbi:MAG: hypothetical protein RLZZ324_426 [Candidatus Parcubacteria bacterium]|jgi:lipoprotein signal peptidase
MTERSEFRAAEAEYAKGALASGKPRAPWLSYAAAALCFIVDRACKAGALTGVTAGWRGTLEFTLFRNTGIAFSIPVPDLVFWPAAVMALALLAYAYARTCRRDPYGAGALMFILLGALSNLFDRAVYGATIDYLLIAARSAVNVADGMIIGGLVALLWRWR